MVGNFVVIISAWMIVRRKSFSCWGKRLFKTWL